MLNGLLVILASLHTSLRKLKALLSVRYSVSGAQQAGSQIESEAKHCP